jgi:hypothetical protein
MIDVPGEIGDVYVRLKGSVGFSAAGTGLNANLGYAFANWVVWESCNPPWPWGDGKCTTHYAPDNINDAAHWEDSFRIGADGFITISTGYKNQPNYRFKLF